MIRTGRLNSFSLGIICEYDPARRREVRRQTVVQVYIVRESVHENDRRFRPRVISDVDPVLAPPNESFLVGHHSLETERRAADKPDEFASFHRITSPQARRS